MKSVTILTWSLVGMLAAGCASKKMVPPPADVTVSPPIVTPDNSLTARVASYNSVGRFVVLSFPVGQMPRLDQTLFLYRGGLKVAELKVTGPQNDNNIVADLVTGDAQAGDEVRDQ
jgi:hypothetical protein